MESLFLLASHETLASSPLLKNTLRLRSDGFVFLYPVLLIFLFLLGRKKHKKITTKKSSPKVDGGLQSMYLSFTLFLNTIIVFIINYIIKAFISRPRPYETLHLPTPTEELALSTIPVDSFPSDHAAVSMTIATTLLFWGYHTQNKGVKSLGRGFFLIAILMGRGRIAIAIHWPTDILAGFVIGGVVAYITTRPSVQKMLQPIWEICISIWRKITDKISFN